MAEDLNQNSIPDVWDNRIGKFLTLIALVLGMLIEWKISAGATLWLTRGVMLLSLMSSVFSWGIIPRPGKVSVVDPEVK